MTILGTISDGFRAVDPSNPSHQVAVMYDWAGQEYESYADGNVDEPFSFCGQHAYADGVVWSDIDRLLREHRQTGATRITILDAGCGPGTWLRRAVIRAREIGFSSIVARGFDLSSMQIDRARFLARDVSDLPGVQLRFEVADLSGPLPEADGSVDLTLCLYSVLSHIPRRGRSHAIGELTRVTRGAVVVTVRSIGSVASGFVHPVETVRYLRQDNKRDVCEIQLHDESRTVFPMHLFSAAELKKAFAASCEIETLIALDLFHTRFLPDPRWNPSSIQGEDRVATTLRALESELRGKPEFLDRGVHILVIARTIAPEQAAIPILPSSEPAAAA